VCVCVCVGGVGIRERGILGDLSSRFFLYAGGTFGVLNLSVPLPGIRLQLFFGTSIIINTNYKHFRT
jgi:hypothetical protein